MTTALRRTRSSVDPPFRPRRPAPRRTRPWPTLRDPRPQTWPNQPPCLKPSSRSGPDDCVERDVLAEHILPTVEGNRERAPRSNEMIILAGCSRPSRIPSRSGTADSPPAALLSIRDATLGARGRARPRLEGATIIPSGARPTATSVGHTHSRAVPASDARASTNAGLDPRIAMHLLVANSARRLQATC
jgi:hypothetical protein